MPVDFDGLRNAVLLVGVIGVASRVAGPHVPLRLAFDHPFRQHLSGAAGLRNPEGKNASLECIGHPRHRPQQRVAVRGIGNRSVNYLGDSGFRQDRHSCHRIFQIPFQPVEIVFEQLKREVLGQRIRAIDPMGSAVPFIRAKIQTELFLAEVIG